MGLITHTKHFSSNTLNIYQVWFQRLFFLVWLAVSSLLLVFFASSVHTFSQPTYFCLYRPGQLMHMILFKKNYICCSSCGNIKSCSALTGHMITNIFQSLLFWCFVSPFRVAASPGWGSPFALSKHNTFLAYHYKHRQRLESRQLEEEIESPRKFVILMLEWITCRYWYI